MNFVSLIEAKRDGRALTPAEWSEFVQGCTSRSLPDYQVAAFLMAVYFRGLDASETRELTLAMRDSGARLAWDKDPRPVVDKHSTGGVGDKVSLPLAPLLACLGFRVPMISGRGLGITGGTLDKLESIPGFRTALPERRITEIVQRTGCVICGQTEHMAPADKTLYALRDVTGTVPSIPLIVASILSKKLAEGIQALVLDVKFGSGAFMGNAATAGELARAMVRLGEECGVRTRALLTDMSAPLGRAAGNWLEIVESVDCLSGKGPGDLRELVVACASSLLVQTGLALSLPAARARASECLDSGEPRRKWREMLTAQGADLDAYDKKLAAGSWAPAVIEVKALASGYVTRCDARALGEVIRDLGGGRVTRESVLDPHLGLDQLSKRGEAVRAGDILARVHGRNRTEAERAAAKVNAAFAISEAPPDALPLVYSVVDAT